MEKKNKKKQQEEVDSRVQPKVVADETGNIAPSDTEMVAAQENDEEIIIGDEVAYLDEDGDYLMIDVDGGDDDEEVIKELEEEAREEILDAKRNPVSRYIRTFFRGWTLFEVCYLVVGILTPVILGLFFNVPALEIVAGVTLVIAYLLLAKAKVEGYVLYVGAFVIYTFVAWRFDLFGEVISSVFVSIPLAIYGLVKALTNKRKDRKKGQVIVISKIKMPEMIIAFTVMAGIGIGFFFLLGVFDTAFLIVSTISITVTVMGEYFVARRSPIGMWGFFLADALTASLWIMWLVIYGYTAAIPLIVTYSMLLINDVYGVVQWRKMRKMQYFAGKRRLSHLLIISKDKNNDHLSTLVSAKVQLQKNKEEKKKRRQEIIQENIDRKKALQKAAQEKKQTRIDNKKPPIS